MPSRPETMKLFIDFLDDVAAEAEVLYILGDFLEIWWGDDEPATGYAEVFRRLGELPIKHGTKVYLMHGNRDFMIGQDLARQLNFEIIDDPYRITLQGRNALLMHGDTLCTDDVEYQKFRQMVRNPHWQQQVMTKTLEERYQLAQSIRDNSAQTTAEKDEYIMDVNQEATDQTFIDNDVELIIHGHTHRPDIHHKQIGGREMTRVVLGDWHDSAKYLRVNDSSELSLQSYP